jgi:NADPH:quinone reductase-like Zn-dependent oxidoreductase
MGACNTRIELIPKACSPAGYLPAEAQWHALKKGDAVVVTTASSWLGDYVLHVAPEAGAATR